MHEALPLPIAGQPAEHVTTPLPRSRNTARKRWRASRSRSGSGHVLPKAAPFTSGAPFRLF